MHLHLSVICVFRRFFVSFLVIIVYIYTVKKQSLQLIMKINEANIEINRLEGRLHSISVDMPVWDKTVEDETISVNIPFLGLKTFAKDDSDMQKAIKEAVNLFCITSEKLGSGLETELRLLGWEFISEDKEGSVIMAYNTSNIIFDQIMETGDKFVETLELIC